MARRTTVIALLALTLLGCFWERQQRSHEAALRDDLSEMRKAIDNYFVDKHRFPDRLNQLVSDHYLRRIPMDPITLGLTWIEVREQSGQGMVDVRSGAPGKSLNGVPYRNF